MLNNHAKSDLELMVGSKEQIFWQGKPSKKCYILEEIFLPLAFCLIWILLLSPFIFGLFSLAKASTDTGMFFIFGGTGLSMLGPIWLWLFWAPFTYLRYKRTAYIITDKGVYVSGGLFAYTCQMKPYTQVSRINVHKGIFDQYLDVGDVVFAIGKRTDDPQYLTIRNIPDYHKVFELVKKLQTDIFSDTMYPNDLRPKENHGYKTKYKGL